MTRIFIINRYFAPDESATSQIATGLAGFLASRNHEVHVLTTDRTYDGRRLPAGEHLGDVQVHRIPSPAGTRQGLVRRAADYVRLYRSFYTAGLAHFRSGDIVIAKTDPPLLSVPVGRAARKNGALLVNWLQDVYPEVAVNLGVPFLKGPAGSALAGLRDRSLRAAAANVVISDGMAARIAERGVNPNTIHVIHNWAQDDLIAASSRADNPLRTAWELEGKFVVGYSGNLGRAHEIETVLGAARNLRTRADILFLFIGGGRLHEELRRRVTEEGLTERFQFRPAQPQETLGDVLSAPDMHLVSLRPEVEGLIFPSKMYGVAAAGRPVVAVAAPDGDVADLVRRNSCGLVVAPGDGQGLARAILTLQHDGDLRGAMGSRGREMIEERYSEAIAYHQWGSLLDAIAKGI